MPKPDPNRKHHLHNLGTRIRFAIGEAELKGITSAALVAHEMGVTTRSLDRYKAGETEIGALELRALARQTEMPFSWFVRDIDETFPEGTTDGRLLAAVEARFEEREVRRAARDGVRKVDSLSRLVSELIRTLHEASPEQLDATRAQLDEPRSRRR